MYKVEFINDNGLSYTFFHENGIVADFNVGDGVPVDISYSQAFGQIGETTERKSVKGREIKVKGCIFRDVPMQKKNLRKIFAPFSAGTLIFNNKYTIRVEVQEPPTFSPVKRDGKFIMLLKAPYPYFKAKRATFIALGRIRGAFRFPINYATPHRFGNREKIKAINIFNNGDVKTAFEINVTSTGEVSNFRISNADTQEFLEIKGAINAGETIRIYRDKNGFFQCDLIKDLEVTSILDRVNEASSLYFLNLGDNPLSVTDDYDGANMEVTITYNTEVAAVYED